MNIKTLSFKALFSTRVKILSFFLLILVSGSLFLWILFSPYPIDIIAHNQILSEAIQDNKFIVPPLYYYGVWLVGQILFLDPSYKFGALIILVGSTAWKYVLTLDILSKEIREANQPILPSALVSLGLMFLFPLILPFLEGSHWYLGKFTPTIWHNSTSVLVLPMCMMMYFEARKWLQSAGSISFGLVLLWGLLVLLTKPSFLFVFIPAFPVAWILYNRSFARGFWHTLLISSLLMIGVWIEKSLIYQESVFGDWFYSNSESAKIGVMPFHVFRSLSDSEIWDVVSSFLFVGISITLLWPELKVQPEFWWNILMLLGGMFLYFTFVETGNRILDGNFYWQIPISLFLLHLLLISQLVRSKISKGQKNILWTIFALQVISGIAYLVRWVLTGSNS